MSDILTSHDDHVLTITLNREDKKNSLTAAMYEQLGETLAQASADPEVRVVVLQGSSRVFSAGNDLSDFQRAAQNPTASRPAFAFLHTIASFPKPIIAAVCGPAVGIGTTILLHCDLAYAGTNAVFSLPFVNLGLCPEAASSLLLPQRAGHALASEMLLLGESFSPEVALRAGLINAVMEPEDVLAHARAKADAIAAKPAESIRLTKALLRGEDARTEISSRIDAEGRHFTELLTGPAAAEAFAAFMEKRRPDFSGL